MTRTVSPARPPAEWWGEVTGCFVVQQGGDQMWLGCLEGGNMVAVDGEFFGWLHGFDLMGEGSRRERFTAFGYDFTRVKHDSETGYSLMEVEAVSADPRCG